MNTHKTKVKRSLTEWKWVCRCGQQQRWTTEESAHYGAWRHLEVEARKAAAS